MANPIFWTNVGIDVQTALGSAITISTISKAGTAVATYSGTPSPAPANGDYVYIESTGMSQTNDRIFRVANFNGTAKTFELEGEDSTTYDTFVSGTAKIITFGASFNSVQNINVSGGEYEKADVTTIHDMIRKQVPTVTSPLVFSMTNLFDLTDPGFMECNKAYKAKTKRAIRLRFGTGARMALVGYCGAAGVPTGQAQGVVQTTVSIDAQNLPSVWAT